jgi:hypothetical protein
MTFFIMQIQAHMIMLINIENVESAGYREDADKCQHAKTFNEQETLVNIKKREVCAKTSRLFIKILCSIQGMPFAARGHFLRMGTNYRSFSL